MVRRVILGSSSLAVTVARRLSDQPGPVSVVTADDSQAEALRESGIAVVQGDPTEESVLTDLPGADVIAAFDADPARTQRATAAAAAVFPAAHVIAVTEDSAVAGTDSVAPAADQVLHRDQETVSALMPSIGDNGLQLRQLLRVLRGIDELAVVTHDNPDPDAIASAVALARIADSVGCRADVCYYGDITHEENRAFVNLLEYDLVNLGPDSDLDVYDGFALVDHSRPGVNDQLPPDHPIDIVIDHHPPPLPVEARFVDLRSEAGATSTLLVDYLDDLGVGFDETVATGLLFGIRVDTDEFTRQVSTADFEAAATLLSHADLGLLERIESPTLSADTLETIAEAIGNRVQEDSVLLSSAGRITRRDSLAQAADRLMALEGIATTLVFGVSEGTIYVSARSRGTDLDLGEILRDAFDQIGSAGGHADMAGAQIRLGVLEAVEDRDESLMKIVEAVVIDRFLEALEAHTTQTVAGVYAPGPSDSDEYLVPTDELDNDSDGDA